MATLLDPDTYTKDTRPKEIQSLNAVYDYVSNAKNSPGNVAPPLNITNGKIVPIRNGLTSPSFSQDLFFGLGNKGSYKLDLIREIILTFVFKIVPLEIPSTIANYSFPAYLYFGRDLNNGELTPYGASIDPLLQYPLGTINWNNTTGYTMSSNPSRDFRLSDYMQYRTLTSTGFYDFSNTTGLNSNEKITKLQYEQIQNEFNSFNANIYYDSAGLTAPQIAHLDANLGIDGGFAGGSFGINLSLGFTFFGASANFIPLQN